MSQTPTQRNPLVLAGFVLVVTAILGAAAYGLNSVTNPQPARQSQASASACSDKPVSHPAPSPTRSYSAAPPMCLDATKSYVATFTTARGVIVVALRADTAPQTTNNFVFLADHGFYDGLTFHRVCPNTADTSCGDGSLKIAQGGDPKGDGTGGPGYSLKDEGPKGPYSAGTISMARAAQISGSQFFIDTADNTSILGPQPQVYNVFGDIVAGLDVAQKLQKNDVMLSVSIEVTPRGAASPTPSPSAAAGTASPSPAASPEASPAASPAVSPAASAPAPSPS
ncbi:MAG: peptidylprolyl isomerase [Candidatus Dormibacteria bacterium]